MARPSAEEIQSITDRISVFDFFQGWQRKTGCVTLFVACALMAASIRTNFIIDEVRLASSYNQIAWLESHCNGLSFIHHKWVMIGVCLPDPVGWTPRSANPGEGGFVSELQIPPFEVRWRWRFLGFEFAEYCHPLGHATATCVTVPFIPNIIALTLISAMLLIRKPQAARRFAN